MLLTDSDILNELVHAIDAIEPQLGPRAWAMLLVAKERQDFEDVKNFQIEVNAFVSDQPGETKIVTLQEFANLFERALHKDGSGYEVLRVIPPRIA